MNFDKKIIGEIKQPYFFFKGKFDTIDSKYFIKKIDAGCALKDNNSFQTNVIGGMTSWNYFNDDIEFLKLIWQIFDVVDKDIDTFKYVLRDSWGLRNGLSHYTREHGHNGNFFSGVIYLNKHSQVMKFPEINEEIKPEPGSFAFFSSFLRHGCTRHRTDSVKYGMSFNCAHTNESL